MWNLFKRGAQLFGNVTYAVGMSVVQCFASSSQPGMVYHVAESTKPLIRRFAPDHIAQALANYLPTTLALIYLNVMAWQLSLAELTEEAMFTLVVSLSSLYMKYFYQWQKQGKTEPSNIITRAIKLLVQTPSLISLSFYLSATPSLLPELALLAGITFALNLFEASSMKAIKNDCFADITLLSTIYAGARAIENPLPIAIYVLPNLLTKLVLGITKLVMRAANFKPENKNNIQNELLLLEVNIVLRQFIQLFFGIYQRHDAHQKTAEQSLQWLLNATNYFAGTNYQRLGAVSRHCDVSLTALTNNTQWPCQFSAQFGGSGLRCHVLLATGPGLFAKINKADNTTWPRALIADGECHAPLALGYHQPTT